MVVFSICCLFVILFGIQHLLNWFWRKNYKDDSTLVIGVVITVSSLILSIALICQIISWGKNIV